MFVGFSNVPPYRHRPVLDLVIVAIAATQVTMHIVWRRECRCDFYRVQQFQPRTLVRLLVIIRFSRVVFFLSL